MMISDIAANAQLIEITQNDVVVAAFEVRENGEGLNDIAVEWYCTDSDGTLLSDDYAPIREISPNEP